MKNNNSDSLKPMITNVRVLLVLPLLITGCCALFDMVVHIQFNLVDFKGSLSIIQWVCRTLVSYFFPSFLVTSLTLLWQDFFTDSWSGIKEGKGSLFLKIVIIYFISYIFYLLLINTSYVIVFVGINLVYVILVLCFTVDDRVLSNKDDKSLPKDSVIKTPQ